jgi:autotransporter-associated beta strand protein
VNANNLTVGGVISGSGFSLTKAGSGTLTLAGANTYTGGTIINAGTLNINNASALGTGTFTIAGGSNAVIDNTTGSAITLSTNNAQAWNGNFTFTGTQSLNLGTGAVTLGASRTVTVSANNLTVGGIISGSGFGLTKAGNGTLTLSGANTFSGSTTVNAGTLTAAASSGSALGSTSGITVNSGGTLMLGASDQINDSASVTLAGGTFHKGNFSEGTVSSVGMGALTLTTSGSHIDFGTGTVGVLSFASFSPNSNTLVIDNWTGTVNMVGDASTDRLIFDSDQASNLGNFQFTGFGGPVTEFALGGGYYEVVPVPEPRTWFAGALAFGALMFTQLRKRSRAGGGG